MGLWSHASLENWTMDFSMVLSSSSIAASLTTSPEGGGA